MLRALRNAVAHFPQELPSVLLEAERTSVAPSEQDLSSRAGGSWEGTQPSAVRRTRSLLSSQSIPEVWRRLDSLQANNSACPGNRATWNDSCTQLEHVSVP